MENKISVVTVSYNACKTIEQTIRSVINQTYKNIEYIIIDGGSTDKTTDIIEKYKDSLSYWCSEPDNGIYDAMNKAINVAKGDYIIFLGADDCFENNAVIQYMVDNLNQNIDVISAPVWEVNESGYQFICSNEHAKDKSKFKGGMIPHAGMLVRLNLMKKYYFDINYRIVADYKFFLQCYLDDSINFKFVDLPIAYFARGGVSTMDTQKRLKEEQKVHNELGLYYNVGAESQWRQMVKRFLIKIKMLDFVRDFVRIHWVWKKHNCNNEMCRWCKRKKQI